MLKMKNTDTCENCYRIICKKCGWQASNEDVLKIQNGELTACPVCGWIPGN